MINQLDPDMKAYADHVAELPMNKLRDLIDLHLARLAVLQRAKRAATIALQPVHKRRMSDYS